MVSNFSLEKSDIFQTFMFFCNSDVSSSWKSSLAMPTSPPKLSRKIIRTRPVTATMTRRWLKCKEFKAIL